MVMISTDTSIVLLHGLGNRRWTLIGLEFYLNWYGYSNVFRPQFNADTLPEISCAEVTRLLIEQCRLDKTQPIVVIGNSMGGVVGSHLHEFGWRIELLITINSPLNGATLLRELDSMLPISVMGMCGGNSPTYNYLKALPVMGIPPHPYKTIGTPLPFMNSDGMVQEQDAMIEAQHHHRIGWGSHHTVVLDPRVYFAILSILQNQ
jgi:pimeloyl-ACP methyl ester carboxylesterase